MTFWIMPRLPRLCLTTTRAFSVSHDLNKLIQSSYIWPAQRAVNERYFQELSKIWPRSCLTHVRSNYRFRFGSASFGPTSSGQIVGKKILKTASETFWPSEATPWLGRNRDHYPVYFYLLLPSKNFPGSPSCENYFAPILKLDT